MAELYRVDFRNKKILSREQLTGAEEPDYFLTSEDMYQYLAKSMQGIDLKILRAMHYHDATQHAKYLAEFSAPERTDRELINDLAKASEADWETDPDYYRALDEAIQLRMKNKPE